MVSGGKLFRCVCPIERHLLSLLCVHAELTRAHGSTMFQAAKAALEALGSDLPKLEFVDLLAGFELFTRVGTALPDDTIECVVCELICKGGRFGDVC